MNGLGYTWQTITWRVAGLITALVLFYLWLRTGEVWMAGLGLVGFFVSWSIAAWLDVHTKPVSTSFAITPHGGSITFIPCCTETWPHTRQDYGEGQHWVTEDVR